MRLVGAELFVNGRVSLKESGYLRFQERVSQMKTKQSLACDYKHKETRKLLCLVLYFGRS